MEHDQILIECIITIIKQVATDTSSTNRKSVWDGASYLSYYSMVVRTRPKDEMYDIHSLFSTLYAPKRKTVAPIIA